LDNAIFDKILLLLGDNSQLHALLEKMGAAVRPVLRLDGKTGITLKAKSHSTAHLPLRPGFGLIPASATMTEFLAGPAALTSFLRRSFSRLWRAFSG